MNKNQRQVSFNVAKKMWLNVKNFTLLQSLTPKFMAKFAGPFPVVKQVFDDSYKLAVPLDFKVHPVFHVLLLKIYFEDSVRPGAQTSVAACIKLAGNHESVRLRQS